MRPHTLILLAFLLTASVGLGGWLFALTGPEQVIGGFATSLHGRTASQTHNLRLAADSLDGKVIPEGGEFSFNRTVGPWTADRGYRKAPVSYDGELLPAWGGGVCQASTTLYNAALLAGLEIAERHRHFWPPKYVAPGRDAAVAFPELDFRFRNPYPSPVRLTARLDRDRLTCSIFSPHRPKVKVALEARLVARSQPVELSLPDPELPSGAWRWRTRGQPGYDVSLYRALTDDRGTRRELISQDHYPTLNRIVRIGAAR